MDEEVIAIEEEWQVHQLQTVTDEAQQEANQIEQVWLDMRSNELELLE
jgi:hypothetical protein